jgi:formate dehydrogenase subunit gamma
MSFSLGHIYIGTIGTEGALEGMVTGEVDVTWAKQHHDLWYEEISGQVESGQAERDKEESAKPD